MSAVSRKRSVVDSRYYFYLLAQIIGKAHKYEQLPIAMYTSTMLVFISMESAF